MYLDAHLHVTNLPRAQWSWFDQHQGVSAAVREADWSANLDVAAKYQGLRIALGLHPFYVEDVGEAGLLSFSQRLQDACRASTEVAAVGETGLDFRKPYKHTKELQLRALSAHAEVAASLRLPLILHCVRAHGALYEALKPFARTGLGVVHAYSGSVEMVKRFTELGLYFSFGGWMTRSPKARAACAKVPPDRLLSETDAPYMPMHGEQSKAADIAPVVAAIAEVRDIRQEDAEALCRDNGHTLFPSLC